MSDSTAPSGTGAGSPDLAGLISLMPFAGAVGVVLESASTEQAVGRLD